MQPAQKPPAYQQGAPQPQTVVTQPQTVVTVQPGSNAVSGAVNQQGSWCWRGLRVTGYMQTVLGILAVLFGIVSIIVKTHLNFIGTPIWCGLCFFVVAGILGIVAGGQKGTGVIVGYMVMSILSSLAAFGLSYVTGGATTLDRYLCPDEWYYNNYNFNSLSYRCSTSTGVRVGIDACILAIGLAEFIISIVGASFTCCGLHYGSSTTPQTMVTYQAYPQQMVVSAPPQGVYYPPGTTVAYPNHQYAVQPAQPYQPPGQFQPPQGQLQPPPQAQF